MPDQADDVLLRAVPPGEQRKPRLRGVHHLAFVTEDLRATLDFYVNVLGMPLIGGMRTPPARPGLIQSKGVPPFGEIPHYFLDMGGDSTIAFFEYPKGSVGPADRNTVGALQHLSFACSPSRYAEMQERLKANGIPVAWGPSVVIQPSVMSIYFFDPNGTRLEITCDVQGDENALDVVHTMTLTREGMRRELRTISDDEAWIERMIEAMPNPDPRDRDDFGTH